MTGPLFPENYSKIWIRGRFITMAGTAVRGKLTLAPTVTGGGLVNRSAKLIMSTAAFSADTDNDGYVSVQVPATNDPDITPVNFTYAVTTPIGQKFSVTVPYDTTPLNSVGDPLHGQPVIELVDMVPVGSSGGVGQLLRGIGIQSMALVDSDVIVTYTNGDVQNLGNFPTAGALASLADYDGTTPPADGQAIVWDATAGKFKPRDVAGAALDPDLADIAALTPTDGQLLVRTAGHWTAADTAEITPGDIGAQPAGNYATLVGGKVDPTQIPAIALTEFLGTVGSQAAMLALTGQRGDWCTRTDLGTDWQLITEPATSLASWREHLYPGSPVQSVAGKTGAVTLTKADVGLGNVDNTADADKPVSTAQLAAINSRGFGYPSSIDTAELRGSDSQALTANRAVWHRVRDGGTITKIALHVATSSGNISVGVYNNSGSGRSAAPAAPIALSGAVACPAVGYAEIPLGATAVVKSGDWIAVSADNATAAFRSGLPGFLLSGLGAGRTYYRDTAHPLPNGTPDSLTAITGYPIVLVGVA